MEESEPGQGHRACEQGRYWFTLLLLAVLALRLHGCAGSMVGGAIPKPPKHVARLAQRLPQLGEPKSELEMRLAGLTQSTSIPERKEINWHLGSHGIQISVDYSIVKRGGPKVAAIINYDGITSQKEVASIVIQGIPSDARGLPSA